MIATGTCSSGQVLDPGPVADLIAGLGLDPSGDFPLVHWTVSPPVLEPGTSLRFRFVGRLRPGDLVEVAEVSGPAGVLTEQHITADGVLAVRTTVERLPVVETAPVPADGAVALVAADADRLRRALVGDDGAQRTAREAVALGLADVWRRSRVPVLGLYVDVHGVADALDGLRRTTTTSAEGSAEIMIAAADGRPILTARVWFGCGVRR